jgi:drug/metabolite transporter (DMT)-like permease
LNGPIEYHFISTAAAVPNLKIMRRRSLCGLSAAGRWRNSNDKLFFHRFTQGRSNVMILSLKEVFAMNFAVKLWSLNQTQSELLLIALIIVRSSTFMMSKVLLRTMQPLNILSVRFVITFAFLMIFFWKKVVAANRGTVFCGLILGALFIATMTSELMGLRSSDSTRIAFLENTAFVFVPLYEAVLKRRLPGVRSLVCAAVTLAGVACLTLRGGFTGFAPGDLFGLLAAMFYASAIVTTDRVSRRHDALTLGLIQMGGMALFSTAAAFLFTSPRLPATAAEWESILVLAVICSGFGFTLQPVAQRGTTSERAGFFCALAPVSAGILGHIFLHETLGLQGIVGAALVLTGLLIPHFWKNAER